MTCKLESDSLVDPLCDSKQYATVSVLVLVREV